MDDVERTANLHKAQPRSTRCALSLMYHKTKCLSIGEDLCISFTSMYFLSYVACLVVIWQSMRSLVIGLCMRFFLKLTLCHG